MCCINLHLGIVNEVQIYGFLKNSKLLIYNIFLNQFACEKTHNINVIVDNFF